ncbi:MAG: daunorubicin resistance transporter ATPase subunit, partial [Frankiales bacterium]|nr:daunorubicin resistance transporter ATPase subunit [Frankiales bacterium]
AIRVRDLVKRYKQVEAVRGLDLDVEAGETFGFLGPNGAGKSTTINILCTLAKMNGGSATVAGFDVTTQRDQVRKNIGLVFQDTTLDSYLTAEMNLRFHAELYGMPRESVADRIEKVMRMVGLWERRASKVLTFSGGMKRRLEIARGLMHSPRVLFLDEPTVGLDPQTRVSIWDYIHELRQQEEITIFLTTHYMDEAEHCDRIAIMDEGTLVALDTPAALKAQVGTDRVTIQTEDNATAITTLEDAVLTSDGIVISVEDGESYVPTLFKKLTVPITSVSISRPSLDDVFLSFTGRTIRDSEQAPGIPAFMAAMGRNR